MMLEQLVRAVRDSEPISTDWGELRWLVSGTLTPGALQTFGIVRIDPGQANPLHAHPNCEELLYVLSGACRHRLGDAEVELEAGQLIRIPAGIPHRARCTSEEPLVAAISFSSATRETVTATDQSVL